MRPQSTDPAAYGEPNRIHRTSCSQFALFIGQWQAEGKSPTTIAHVEESHMRQTARYVLAGSAIARRVEAAQAAGRSWRICGMKRFSSRAQQARSRFL